MEVQEGLAAFACFEAAVQRAREDRENPDRKQEMAMAFRQLLEVTGRRRSYIAQSGIGKRPTIDQWFRGTAIPHSHHVGLIKRLLFPVLSDRDLAFGYSLEDARYQVVNKFIGEDAVSSDEVEMLFRVASISKGILTPEMMRCVLGWDAPRPRLAR